MTNPEPAGALSPAPGAMPDMRYIPAGTFEYWGDTVAIRLAANPRLPWHCSNGARLTDEQVANAQRLVPVGPLLELAARWDKIHDELDARADVTCMVYRIHARQLRALLASLAEAPDSPGNKKKGQM